MLVRPAVFAGSWYPASAETCRRQIEDYFKEAPEAPADAGDPVGGIVPHAGWTFSGRLAAAVVGLLKGADPDTVILLGGHLSPRDPHRVMMEGQWDTPFGPLAVDEEMAAKLAGRCSMHSEDPRRDIPDNTRELQLPLIAHAFPGVRILPLEVAPTHEGIEIGARCAELSQELGRRVLALGSTDLTHYGPSYGFTPLGGGADAERWVTQELDPRVIEQMKKMDAPGILREGLTNHNACCSGAAAAAVACVKALGARMSQVAGYSTSKDVMPGDDFVGYVGVVYWT